MSVALGPHVFTLTHVTYNQTRLKPIRSTDTRGSKPIAHCEPRAFKGKLTKPLDSASTACTSASDFALLDILDVAMEDITEGESDVPGVPNLRELCI